ncbi:hypothetical protein HA466_0167240 [Hirschfeldia incana]|nr:hypothetical protein HA466_0167240 [Hirschfeldia incana]
MIRMNFLCSLDVLFFYSSIDALVPCTFIQIGSSTFLPPKLCCSWDHYTTDSTILVWAHGEAKDLYLTKGRSHRVCPFLCQSLLIPMVVKNLIICLFTLYRGGS